MILGIILLIVGIASALYGNSLNNSFQAQLSSILGSGSMNPGNVWLYLGIVVAIIGIVLLIAENAKKSEQ